MLSSNEGCRSKPSVSHAEQPDIVVGDVNSTMACTITAKKLGIKIAHVETGLRLRSRDMGMPEEINRLCTDVLCDFLFTTDRLADENLRAEGVAEEKIVFVGCATGHERAVAQGKCAGEVGWAGCRADC